VCWNNYLESIAKGAPNAMQSALDAGYEPDSAKNITLTGWFKGRLEKLKLKEMRSKAERNLVKILDTDWEKDGEVKPEIMRIVGDISHKTAKALGKEDWSDRLEHTGADGKDLQIQVVSYADTKEA
jgi:hypothetical protein